MKRYGRRFVILRCALLAADAEEVRELAELPSVHKPERSGSTPFAADRGDLASDCLTKPLRSRGSTERILSSSACPFWAVVLPEITTPPRARSSVRVHY